MFDPAVMALSGLAVLVPRCSMIIDDLAQLSDNDLATRPLPAFPKLALWLLRDARDSVRLLDSFDAWIPSMLELERTRSGRNNFAVLLTYMFEVIDPMHRDELRAKIRMLGSRTEEAAMTIAEQLRKEGRKQGLEKGLERVSRRASRKASRKAAKKAASPPCAACSCSSSRRSTQHTRLA